MSDSLRMRVSATSMTECQPVWKDTMAPNIASMMTLSTPSILQIALFEFELELQSSLEFSLSLLENLTRRARGDTLDPNATLLK